MRNVQVLKRIALCANESALLSVKAGSCISFLWPKVGRRAFSLDNTKRTDDLRRYYDLIGQREVVGFGINGMPDYVDSVSFPYPAIRFREISPDYKALKEKEKGNWKTLTLNEKKCLYRISFCQTLAEVDSPTGEWKKIIGSTLLVISAAIWLHLMVQFLTRTDPPESFKHENQLAQLKRMLDLKMNPIEGISAMWDYENNNWKGYPSRKEGKAKKYDQGGE